MLCFELLRSRSLALTASLSAEREKRRIESARKVIGRAAVLGVASGSERTVRKEERRCNDDRMLEEVDQPATMGNRHWLKREKRTKNVVRF